MKNRRIFFLILLLSISNKIFSQEIEWQNTVGGNQTDYLESISPTSDGGYIVGGNSSSDISGDKTENCLGMSDFWIVKLDSNGTVQWENTIGGSDYDLLRSILQTPDGGYVVAGRSLSDTSADKTENSIGGNDYWVLKLDPFGSIQWQNTIGGYWNDFLADIALTSDNGYILGGYSSSDIGVDKTENSYGSSDYWIIKLDSLGNIQWQKTIGGSGTEALFSISQTFDNGYILGGWSDSNISGNKTENCLGSADYWIVKLDSVGTIVWQNTIGGNSMDALNSISQTQDSGYIAGGTSHSQISGDKSESNHGAGDYWIVKLDSAGSIQWENTIGGNGIDQLNDISQTPEGEYIIGGTSSSIISDDKTENIYSSNADYWVIKINELGLIQWQNTIGGANIENLNVAVFTSDAGYMLGGSSSSGISFDKTEVSHGNNDYWVVKLTCDYNMISGTEYADLNSNNLQETTEHSIPYKRITESNTARFGFTNHNGQYSFEVLNSGSFQVAPESQPSYYVSVPANHNITFSSVNQIDSLNDFAFQPTGTYDDLCISITPTGNFLTGMNASYMLSYSNVGTTSISNTTVVFFPDTNVTYISSSIPPLNITSDSVVFSIGSLSPYQTGQIVVTVQVDPGMPNYSLINSSATILPILGDANPGCNQAYFTVITTGAPNPIDMVVNRYFLFSYEIPNEPILEYIIRFQNTGNDTVFNVKLSSPIDTTRLQLNTLEIVSASHPALATWIPWERNMQFRFDNILLPDSNINEPLSHGFIRYKIKPKTNLLLGDIITGMAGIYFDFNDPVLTNKVNTEIILFTGIHESDSTSTIFDVYPNPARTVLNIQFQHNFQNNTSLELYSAFGQKMQTFDISSIPGNNFVKTIDISKLASGVYFLRLQGNSSFVKKFVKY